MSGMTAKAEEGINSNEAHKADFLSFRSHAGHQQATAGHQRGSGQGGLCPGALPKAAPCFTSHIETPICLFHQISPHHGFSVAVARPKRGDGYY
jgi:hypothetical protein